MAPKTSFGIRIKDDLVEALNEIVEECVYLNTSRSEVVEAILWSYFYLENSEDRHTNKISKLIIKKRQNKLDRS
jgi:metal-responsive CopG/Arc/MetJ family transcriptional regulator